MLRKIRQYISSSLRSPEKLYSDFETKKGCLTYANAVTGLGILLVFFYDYQQIFVESPHVACLLPTILLIGLTDFFDGFIARIEGSTTLGKWLDIIRNRLFVYSVILTAVLSDKLGTPFLLVLALELTQERPSIYESKIIHRDRKIKFSLFLALAIALSLRQKNISFCATLTVLIIAVNLKILHRS